MCQEVLELVCKMNTQSIGLQMALQCAPVIKGIKISNLFHLQECEEKHFRQLLKKSHLHFCYMSNNKGRITYLVFRQNELEEYLNQKEVRDFLKREGYQSFSLGKILRRFRERYEAYVSGETDMFPHEIGLVLGYPVDDVIGFIEHKGQGYLYSGYWKVYSHVDEKISIFESYENAKEEMIQLIAAKIDIRSIIEMYNQPQQSKAAC